MHFHCTLWMGELALTCLDRSSKETTNGASMGDLFKKGGRASRALPWQPQPVLSAAESVRDRGGSYLGRGEEKDCDCMKYNHGQEYKEISIREFLSYVCV